jgi:hypothetical protein
MTYDYGFALPDVRHSFYAVGPDGEPGTESKITVRIQRHWHPHPEDDEVIDYDCSFNIYKDDELVIMLPVGTSQQQAEEVAHILAPLLIFPWQ